MSSLTAVISGNYVVNRTLALCGPAEMGHEERVAQWLARSLRLDCLGSIYFHGLERRPSCEMRREMSH